jgi:hypothetical protein
MAYAGRRLARRFFAGDRLAGVSWAAWAALLDFRFFFGIVRLLVVRFSPRLIRFWLKNADFRPLSNVPQFR